MHKNFTAIFYQFLFFQTFVSNLKMQALVQFMLFSGILNLLLESVANSGMVAVVATKTGFQLKKNVKLNVFKLRKQVRLFRSQMFEDLMRGQ